MSSTFNPPGPDEAGDGQPVGDPAPPPTAGAPPDGATADSGSLALAISGLIEPSPAPAGTDRRGVALVAIALMVVDLAAIGALRHRRHRVFSG